MKKEYITVHGKQYNSYVAISHDYDVEVQELLRYVNAGYSAEEAVAQCRNACRRGTDRKAYRIELDGAAYASLSEACRKIGISTSSTYQKKKAIMQQTGVSEHEATIQALQYLSARRTEKRGGRARESCYSRAYLPEPACGNTGLSPEYSHCACPDYPGQASGKANFF